MYIGAWTEYRLAQEQLHNRRRAAKGGRDDAAQPSSYGGSNSTKRAGIYHPSLAEKGGTEVAALPDRESFRRTLESALSSNLAADDAEHISRALEPLMQRLPAIRVAHNRQGMGPAGAAGAKLGRYMRQGGGRSWRLALSRHCGGSRQARSDAGTRQMKHDGTGGSTRSEYSVASAPTGSTASRGGGGRLPVGLADGGIAGNHGWMRVKKAAGVGPRPRASHLPLIVDARNPRNAPRNNSCSDHGGHGGASVSTTTKTANGTDAGMKLSGFTSSHSDGHNFQKICPREQPVNAATASSERSTADEAVMPDGGYDSGKAATMLRVARRRDPAGLKPDFQQFWVWNKRLARSAKAGEVTGREGAFRTPTKRAGAGSAGTACEKQACSNKVAALARMKNVYMGKGEATSSNNIANAEPPVKCETQNDAGMHIVTVVPGAAHPPTTGAHLAETQPGRIGGTIGSDSKHHGRALVMPYEPRADGGVEHDNANNQAVVVPDLELTDSRIQLVEKYFGGGRGVWEAGRRASSAASRKDTAEPSEERDQRRSASLLGAAGEIAEDPIGSSLIVGCGASSSNSSSSVDFGLGCRGGASRRASGEKGGEDTYPKNDYAGSSSCCGHALEDMCDSGCRRPQRQAAECPPSEPQVVNATGDFRANSSVAGRCTEGYRGNAGMGVERPARLSPERRSGRGAVVSASPPVACVSPLGVVAAPAWCGDTSNSSASLEDLVCWTEGLDFDAAMKNF